MIVTLYNYGAYIGQCLESLEDSHTGAIPGGIEAVIVNDASTDNSLKQACGLQRISRHPVRIIDKQLNTGLADARNLGLQLARAPYAFILDADNMLFPRALEQLHATIVRDNSAAAYSILCRFQGAHNNREGLLSYYDWDPQMLIEYPYIDAMAMFDREQLIKIGGYDTELYKYGWFGWEDYDLWLRIAEADLRVSFLPNVLCLYRHHEKAMSNTTNLFERELVAHLLEKYGSLIENYPPKRRLLGVDRSWFEGAVEQARKNASRQVFSVRFTLAYRPFATISRLRQKKFSRLSLGTCPNSSRRAVFPCNQTAKLPKSFGNIRPQYEKKKQYPRFHPSQRRSHASFLVYCLWPLASLTRRQALPVIQNARFADRVAYQRAIEEVYWRHRIWPKERPDPKPSLDEVMPPAQLNRKSQTTWQLAGAGGLLATAACRAIAG